MTDESDDPAGLLDVVRRGDQGALAALFSEHRERLRRMVEFRLDARLKGRVSTSDVLPLPRRCPRGPTRSARSPIAGPVRSGPGPGRPPEDGAGPPEDPIPRAERTQDPTDRT
jgi:hypothetical protein